MGEKIKRLIKKLLHKYKTNIRTKQVVALFAINLLGIPIGIFTSIVITRYLGVQGYGDFKFIHSIFSLAIIVFTFGFFQAGNRALVLNTNPKKAKEYYGAELLITGGLFIIMSLFLVFYVLLDNNLQEKQLDKFLFLLIPFGWVFLLTRYFETLFQADNKIRLLGQVRLYPKVGFLIMGLLLYFDLIEYKTDPLGTVWIFYLGTELIVYTLILIKLKISFKNVKDRIIEIWNHNKSFGLNVYLGSVFAVGLSQLTQILISYFGIDNSGVGYYALALTFTMPLTFIPNTIATTHYKDFSTTKVIPKKILLITIGLSFFALFCLWIIIPPFIHYFYGIEFESVILLNFIVSLGVVAHGFGDFFNRFLGANGQGKALRNSSIIIGITLLTTNLILIPILNEKGAAISRLLSGVIYLISMLFYYKSFLKKSK